MNYKTYTNYYLLWCENPNKKFNNSEISDLYTVANQCSNLGGKSVLQAQLFLEYVLGKDDNWNYNCPIPASLMRKAKAFTNSKKNSLLSVENYLSISPTPAQDYITIQYAKIDAPQSYEVFDLAGKKLFESPFHKDSKQIDISILNGGIYFIVFNLESNRNVTKKLIVATIK